MNFDNPIVKEFIAVGLKHLYQLEQCVHGVLPLPLN
jgi:hypothetical protein